MNKYTILIVLASILCACSQAAEDVEEDRSQIEEFHFGPNPGD